MGIEDAGTLVWLLKTLCLDEEKHELDLRGSNYNLAIDIYEALRIPRARQMLEASKAMGARQDRRVCRATRAVEEAKLQREIHRGLEDKSKLPAMFQGFDFEYKEEIDLAIAKIRAEEAERRVRPPSPKSVTDCTIIKPKRPSGVKRMGSLKKVLSFRSKEKNTRAEI